MRASFRDRTAGKWHGILHRLGVDDRSLTGKHAPCPMCPGQKSFRFDDKQGHGNWICTHCGSGDGPMLLISVNDWSFAQMAREVEAIVGGIDEPKAAALHVGDRSKSSIRLFEEAVRISEDDPVFRYLDNRWCRNPDAWSVLRYHPECEYRHDNAAVTVHPAMVAPVIGPGGEIVSVHRTYLTMDGEKARVPEPRKMTAGSIPHGSAIRLAPPGDALGIAEGIETAISAMNLFFVPCWAAMNSAGLASWQPPASVKHVIVFGDNDAKFGGQSAAYSLAHRLSISGYGAEVRIPEHVSEDWNDVWVDACRGGQS